MRRRALSYLAVALSGGCLLIGVGQRPASAQQPSVMLCHATGRLGEFIYIQVSLKALPAHLAHGDFLAANPAECEGL